MFQTKIKSYIPQIYSHFLPKEILELKINETKVNCSNCTMAYSNAKKITYNINLKCCTYYPYLPNYLVGAILSDPTMTEAHKIIRKMIETRRYCLPIGLTPPVKYQMLFNKKKKNDFGNDPQLLCPYYNKKNNNCNIWKYRESVCTTFICFSSYGKKGINFWEHMNDYLTYVEMALMEEALVMLDFSPRDISNLLGYLNRDHATNTELKNWNLPKHKAIKLWNGYYDEQENFYKKCYGLVKKMTKKDFYTAMGLQGKNIESNLRENLFSKKA